MLSLTTRSILLFWTAIMLVPACALAQGDSQPASADEQTSPAEVRVDSSSSGTPGQTTARCWKILTENVQDMKHIEIRSQALNAVSSLGSNPRAVALIATALKDPNLDVRTAAILAAGKTRSRALVKPVRELLNDPEPQVVFVAATALWKQFKDKSGEDILSAIAAGDRKAGPGLVHGAANDVSRTLHSRATLAKMGLETGAGLVLGPFGFSVAAIEYMRKNGADTARVQAIDLLAEEKSEAMHAQMLSALDDSDPGVRASAVKAMGGYHRPRDSRSIAALLDDSKLPVRLAAAAAYIDCATKDAHAKPPRS